MNDLELIFLIIMICIAVWAIIDAVLSVLIIITERREERSKRQLEYQRRRYRHDD